MNVFVQQLIEKDVGDLENGRLVVEDNIGESIHVHFRNTRLEMSIEEFLEFADELEPALRRFENGDR